MAKQKKTNQNKANRKEQRRKQLDQEQKMSRLRLWVPLGVIIIGAIIALVFRFNVPDVEGVVFVSSATANQHDESIHYEFDGVPPTGGVHRPTWQNCGIYEEPVLPEYAIHSMEHGAVWITYHPSLPNDQVASLQAIVSGKGHLLLSPYPDQENDIILTAWDVQLTADSISDPRIQEFVDKYRFTRGPESAGCNGGVGSPLG